MKISFEEQGTAAIAGRPVVASVRGETDPLTDVVLCSPTFLSPVPCCSVTRERLREGFATSTEQALRQHRSLHDALSAKGVACHLLPAEAAMADLCFTRDIAVTTPWGLVALAPAMPHRSRESDHLARVARRWTAGAIGRIGTGTIEGGDICIARPGLLILGISGERTDEAGAEAFAARFHAEGWDVLTYRYDPHFLHLDTLFCMLDSQHALACTEVLDDALLDAVAARGITVLPVTYKEARRLGCNVLSIDGRTILAGAGTPRVSTMMRDAGFEVIDLDIEQFTACGGGIHCLTMPLARTAR